MCADNVNIWNGSKVSNTQIRIFSVISLALKKLFTV